MPTIIVKSNGNVLSKRTIQLKPQSSVQANKPRATITFHALNPVILRTNSYEQKRETGS